VYRHWRDYHATICYMILCNLLYYFLVQDRILWQYTPKALLDHVLSEVLMTFVVFPCTVMLFLHAMMTTEGSRRAPNGSARGSGLWNIAWDGAFIGRSYSSS